MQDALKSVRGLIGPPRKFQVHGWVFDANSPDAHLSVEIVVDGETLGTTTAALFYEHLAKAGIGRGDHGFVFNADRELPVDERHRLQVFALAPAGRKEIPHAKPAAPPLAKAKPAAPQAMTVEKPRFPHPGAEPAHRPVFILGSARSGTSAVGQALARNTRYVGHGEGHLLDLAAKLAHTVTAHYAGRRGEWADGVKTMIAAAPEAFLRDAVRYGFSELARQLFPLGFWLDKTPRPEMILAAPELIEIWPNAKFVFMRRRGFENIESRRRKFPQIDFDKHCRGWVDSFAAWSKVRPLMGGRAVEIDQVKLSQAPGECADALAGLLNLDRDECARLRQSLTVDLPERTSVNFAEVHDLARLAWTAEQWRAFDAICGETMCRWGYGGEAAYFLPGREREALTVL